MNTLLCCFRLTTNPVIDAMAAVGSIGRRGAAAAGVAAFALSSVVSCDAAHDASLKQRRATTDTVVGTLGTKHVIGYIWVSTRLEQSRASQSKSLQRDKSRF